MLHLNTKVLLINIETQWGIFIKPQLMVLDWLEFTTFAGNIYCINNRMHIPRKFNIQGKYFLLNMWLANVLLVLSIVLILVFHTGSVREEVFSTARYFLHFW